MSTETINHPPHYGGEDNQYEAIKVIEAWGLDFCLGNALKYISRAGKKDDTVQDLKKAQWYLQRKIDRMEAAKVPPNFDAAIRHPLGVMPKFIHDRKVKEKRFEELRAANSRYYEAGLIPNPEWSNELTALIRDLGAGSPAKMSSVDEKSQEIIELTKVSLSAKIALFESKYPERYDEIKKLKQQLKILEHQVDPNELKVGTVLIAKDEHVMPGPGGLPALIIGKEYPIEGISSENIFIKSEVYRLHIFQKSKVNKYFTIKVNHEIH